MEEKQSVPKKYQYVGEFVQLIWYGKKDRACNEFFGECVYYLFVKEERYHQIYQNLFVVPVCLFFYISCQYISITNYNFYEILIKTTSLNILYFHIITNYNYYFFTDINNLSNII